MSPEADESVDDDVTAAQRRDAAAERRDELASLRDEAAGVRDAVAGRADDALADLLGSAGVEPVVMEALHRARRARGAAAADRQAAAEDRRAAQEGGRTPR